MKKVFIIFILIIIYSYTLLISHIPDNLIIFEGETINVNNLLGFKIKNKEETIETSSSSKTISKTGKSTVQVSLFDNIFIKNMEVDVLPRTKVIPVRENCWC